MKVKAIITAALLMACTIASAQTEKKYYMNVQTAPEEVQSYEVNSDLKVSWEQTQKGVTPSGYYSKDEVDAMLQNLVDYYKLESLTIGLTDEDGKHDYGLIDKSREINYLLWGRRAMDNVEADVIRKTVPDEGSILERLDNHQRYLEEICCLLTGHRSDLYNLEQLDYSFPDGVLTYLTDICLLLTGDSHLDLFEYYYRSFFPYGVLDNLIPHAKPETTPSMELMEENKVLKNKLAELERRLEALEAKK